MNTPSSIMQAGELLTSPVRRLFRSVREKAGKAPGTLVYVGPERAEPVQVHLIRYREELFEEGPLSGDADYEAIRKGEPLTWINVDGLNDLDLIQRIGTAFGLHPLVLEDLVHTGQRPKHEEYEDSVFVVLRMLTSDSGGFGIRSEQVGIVFGDGFVLSFQEKAGDVFESVRERIRIKSRRIRSRGADYLSYALIDAIVDHYFHILEDFAEQVEQLEVEVLETPTQGTMRRIHNLRHEMLAVRRAIWPLREVTNGLVRTESGLIEESTQVFLRDVYDHTVQVIDTAETLREVVSGLMDLYMSSVSNRMNEIMKVLTIMASVFIPLTFMAGVYGMNFEFMPELGVPWAYPALLALMAGIGAGLLYFFKRKGWL